jgi:tetratricopeptide (TPR) repeat protein
MLLRESFILMALKSIYQSRIKNYEKTLSVYNRKENPVEYATTLGKLGELYLSFRKNGSTQQTHLNKAIGLFQEVLEICTFEKYPKQYAETNENLGYAYVDLAELSEKNYHLNQAVKSLEEALKVTPFKSHPEEYCRIQNQLGKLYMELSGADPNEYLKRAFSAFEASLKYYTVERFPFEYATNMNNIGIVYKNMAEQCNSFSFNTVEEFREYRVDRISNAIGAFRGALGVYLNENILSECAKVHFNMGEAYRLMIPIQDKSESITNAIKSYEEALKVYTPAQYPAEYKRTMLHLEKVKQYL